MRHNEILRVIDSIRGHLPVIEYRALDTMDDEEAQILQELELAIGEAVDYYFERG